MKLSTKTGSRIEVEWTFDVQIGCFYLLFNPIIIFKFFPFLAMGWACDRNYPYPVRN